MVLDEEKGTKLPLTSSSEQRYMFDVCTSKRRGEVADAMDAGVRTDEPHNGPCSQ